MFRSLPAAAKSGRNFPHALMQWASSHTTLMIREVKAEFFQSQSWHTLCWKAISGFSTTTPCRREPAAY